MKNGIEASLLELRQLIEEMERGDQTIEEALAQYEKGIRLIRSCGRQIEEIEKKIQIVNEDEDDGTV